MQERGLWNLLDNKKLYCKLCSEGKDSSSVNCCATKCLENQPDFAEQKEWLQEIVEENGCKIIFFPKFHCELNFIEMVWAYLKKRLRDECCFSFDDLQSRVLSIISDIPLTFIRKASRYCFRFMDGYRLGMAGPLLDYAMKKYHGHRMFPSDFVLSEFNKEYDSYRKIKAEKYIK